METTFFQKVLEYRHLLLAPVLVLLPAVHHLRLRPRVLGHPQVAQSQAQVHPAVREVRPHRAQAREAVPAVRQVARAVVRPVVAGPRVRAAHRHLRLVEVLQVHHLDLAQAVLRDRAVHPQVADPRRAVLQAVHLQVARDLPALVPAVQAQAAGVLQVHLHPVVDLVRLRVVVLRYLPVRVPLDRVVRHPHRHLAQNLAVRRRQVAGHRHLHRVADPALRAVVQVHLPAQAGHRLRVLHLAVYLHRVPAADRHHRQVLHDQALRLHQVRVHSCGEIGLSKADRGATGQTNPGLGVTAPNKVDHGVIEPKACCPNGYSKMGWFRSR